MIDHKELFDLFIYGTGVIFFLLVYHMSSCKRTIPIFYKRTFSKYTRKNSFPILVIFSTIWLVITFSLIQENSFIKDQLKSILEPRNMALNNWGDFLAGFVAPLAFIWIGFGVYFQKREFSNIVKSFDLQKKEFKKSVDVMKDQVIQIEIQQYNTWFNRNIQSLNNTRDKLFKNIKVQEIDSIFPIYKSLQVDIESEKDLFNIFDEIKLMVDISENINIYINKELKQNGIDIKLFNILKDLQNELHLLEGDDSKYSKMILKKVYILIASGKIYNSYKKYYETYGEWIKNYDFITDFIISQNKTTELDNIKSAFEAVDTLELSDLEGKINGTI